MHIVDYNSSYCGNATEAWHLILSRILGDGMEQTSRGMATREVIDNSVSIPLVYPVVADLNRKLNYAFMAAEAKWVLDGDNRLSPLMATNPRMEKYSDDGITMAGAYGKSLHPQMAYILRTLTQDPGSRQAVATTWNRAPQPSRDIPCTLTWLFFIRDNELHLRVDMRSSDAWLGVPYDLFTFSAVGLHVLGILRGAPSLADLRPGRLLWSAASSHLYCGDIDSATMILDTHDSNSYGFVGNAPWLSTVDDWLYRSLRATAEKNYDSATWRIKPQVTK